MTTHVSKGYADQIAKDRGEAMDELERRTTPTPVPAASERMTAEELAAEIEGVFVGDLRVTRKNQDTVTRAAAMLRTLTARAEAADADVMEKSSALVRLSALLAKDGEIRREIDDEQRMASVSHHRRIRAVQLPDREHERLAVPHLVDAMTAPSPTAKEG